MIFDLKLCIRLRQNNTPPHYRLPVTDYRIIVVRGKIFPLHLIKSRGARGDELMVGNMSDLWKQVPVGPEGPYKWWFVPFNRFFG